MKSEFASDVFANPKDDSFDSSINQIYQTFGGQDCYPTLEEKAAMLLYLITKNHSFFDGNKRIAASCFLYFLDKNNMLNHDIIQPSLDKDTEAKVKELESKKRVVQQNFQLVEMEREDTKSDAIREKLLSIDIDDMSPRDAWNMLNDLCEEEKKDEKR